MSLSLILIIGFSFIVIAGAVYLLITNASVESVLMFLGAIVMILVLSIGSHTLALHKAISMKKIENAISVCETNEGTKSLSHYYIECNNGGIFVYDTEVKQ